MNIKHYSDNEIAELPNNWYSIKTQVYQLIDNGNLSPLFSKQDFEDDLNNSDDTLDKCCLCYTTRKEYPLNTFKCSCQGYISICTNCLLNDNNYNIYNNNYKCSKCNHVSQNHYNNYTTQRIIDEAERRERIEFEKHINNNILNVYHYYNIEIPLYLPYDLINLIDINVIDNKDMANVMLENILAMM